MNSKVSTLIFTRQIPLEEANPWHSDSFNCQERVRTQINFLKYRKGNVRKVFIAYPAILKYLDDNGNPKIVRDEDIKRPKDEVQEKEGRRHDKGDLNLPSSAARLNELRTAKVRTVVKR